MPKSKLVRINLRMYPAPWADSASLATDEGVAKWIAAIRDGAHTNLKTSGTLLPVAFFIARKNPQTGETLPGPLPVIVPLASMEDKDDVADSLRWVAKALDASACSFVSEAWQKTPMGATVAEIAICTLERQGHQAQTFMSYVSRDDNDDTSVSVSDWSDIPGASAGRFVSILGDQSVPVPMGDA